VIEHGIGINDILRKCRARSYSSVPEYTADWSILFANAKKYNGEGSWIAVDANALEIELNRLLTKNNLLEKPEPPKKTLRIKLSLKKLKSKDSNKLKKLKQNRKFETTSVCIGEQRFFDLKLIVEAYRSKIP